IVSASATLGSSLGPAQVLLQTTGGLQTPFGPTTGPVALQTIFTMTVIQAQPASLRILTGANQSVLAGAVAQLPLTARVEDAAGNPLPNIPVVWTGQSVSVNAAAAVSDANGTVSASATMGSTAGP